MDKPLHDGSCYFIVWRDGTSSLWLAWLWTMEQLEAMTQIESATLLSHEEIEALQAQ